jgi:nucleotide-binding universal stress UspA family protein
MYRRILVPLDGSRLSEQVLPFVRSIGASSSADIVLLRVAEYPYGLFAGCEQACWLNPDFVKRTNLQKKVICDGLTNYLEGIAAKLQRDGFRTLVEVCDGPVVHAILATVQRLAIDLIAMSTQGSGAPNPWMMGSVADRVLRESPIQVFLFRPDQGEINPGRFEKPDSSFGRRPDEIRLWSSPLS